MPVVDGAELVDLEADADGPRIENHRRCVTAGHAAVRDEILQLQRGSPAMIMRGALKN